MPAIGTLSNNLFPVSLVNCLCYVIFLIGLGYHRKSTKHLLYFPPFKKSPRLKTEKYRKASYYALYALALLVPALLTFYFVVYAGLDFIFALKKITIALGFAFTLSSLGLIPFAMGVMSLRAAWFAYQKRPNVLNISSLPVIDRDRSFLTQSLTIFFAFSSSIFVAGIIAYLFSGAETSAHFLLMSSLGLTIFPSIIILNHLLETEYCLTLSNEAVFYGINTVFFWDKMISYSLEEENKHVIFKAEYKTSPFDNLAHFSVAIPSANRSKLQEFIRHNFSALEAWETTASIPKPYPQLESAKSSSTKDNRN